MALPKMTDKQKQFIENKFAEASAFAGLDNNPLSYEDFKPSEVREMIEEADSIMAAERGETTDTHILDGWFSCMGLQSRAFEKMMRLNPDAK